MTKYLITVEFEMELGGMCRGHMMQFVTMNQAEVLQGQWGFQDGNKGGFLVSPWAPLGLILSFPKTGLPSIIINSGLTLTGTVKIFSTLWAYFWGEFIILRFINKLFFTLILELASFPTFETGRRPHSWCQNLSLVLFCVNISIISYLLESRQQDEEDY